jgi:hypothetical protein
MALSEPHSASHTDARADLVFSDPAAVFDTPQDVIWDPHLDHDARIRVLDRWLDRERLQFRADRDPVRVTRMRQIESAIRMLTTMRRGEGRGPGRW